MILQKISIYTVFFTWSCVISFVLADYKIGVGRADCTGPAAGIVFMGYAKSTQKGCGIHLRQFARAFIFDDGQSRAAFVSIDAAMMNHGVRREVLRRLSQTYGNTYNVNNVVLSGTHSHGTPGGFMQNVLYDLPDFGFVKESFDALVDGIINAIGVAHNNMVDSKIYVTSGELLNTNINRSPAAYLLNPEWERKNYPYDVDKDLVQLKFVKSSDNKLFGAINWFAVHPTSMNSSNCLVTSDNVGYASILLESSINEGSLPGEGSFVGAFASSNLGDVSPNIKGPRCINTGKMCDNVTSSCDGKNEYCIASGPGKDMFQSTEIIAGNLFKKAKELLSDTQAEEVTGPVKFIHQFIDMPKATATVNLKNGTTQELSGCLPAMGYAFAAGTTDGPGDFNFVQATNSTNPFWNTLRNLVFPPTDEDVKCHSPKPILIMSGRINFPYEWQPQIISAQIVQIGNVALIAVPGELTTMSGRRIRNITYDSILSNGGSQNTRIIIAGLSNVYSSYIATFEEYQLQRYEAASTIYGPHTQEIYMQKYRDLAIALTKGKTLDPGPTPPDFSQKLLTFVPPVLFDYAGWSKNFGDCILQPPEEVSIGDIVSATFIAGHPRNGVMHGKTFLTVEKLNGANWTVIATDACWETKFIWKRTNILLGISKADIQWEVKDDVKAGTYRIGHFGNYKLIGFNRGIFPYQGYTRNFKVV